MKMKKKTTFKQVGLSKGFRSGLEERNMALLLSLGIEATYEQFTLTYTKPAKTSKYTPDFVLPNGIIIETKGRFVLADREKHKLIKVQFPDLDIRFVFSNPKQRISKQSKTTYGAWCDRYGFLYAHQTIPEKWTREPLKGGRVVANLTYLGWNPGGIQT